MGTTEKVKPPCRVIGCTELARGVRGVGLCSLHYQRFWTYYYTLIHVRTEAVKAGFPAHYRKCSICKKFDDPSNMYVKPSGNHQRHRECMNQLQREKYNRRK